jgi:IS1 family transposase
MSSWRLFPPRTQELQLDEKWSFVYQKQDRCNPEEASDHTRGDCWDHVAFDPEHRLVLAVVFGKRSNLRILRLMQQVRKQLGGRVPRLITSDDYAGYQTVLDLVWNQPERPRPSGQGRRRPPRKRRKQKRLNYATVCKRRKDGRVVSVEKKIIFGTEKSVAKALAQSGCSHTTNTSFLERHNGTDRHRNARKARRTYRFSKQWKVHEAVGYFSYYTYNFCWCVRTLAVRQKDGRRQQRTPAMAAGLTDHIWSLMEWLSYPVANTT